MRALILSDIHANIDALDAVLNAAPAHDAVWNLGDMVGYGACPNEVVERARALGRTFVRGNHDRVCCGLADASEFNSIALRAAHWTEQVLTENNQDWLRTVPRGPVLPNGPQVGCVHGSPLDEDHYVLSLYDAAHQLAHTRTRITFFGHTHVQGAFAVGRDGDRYEMRPTYGAGDGVESWTLDLRETASYLLNPGSVGQPRDHDWRAAFALYDDEAQQVTFWRTPYPVRVAQARILRAGLPEILATRLFSGR